MSAVDVPRLVYVRGVPAIASTLAEKASESDAFNIVCDENGCAFLTYAQNSLLDIIGGEDAVRAAQRAIDITLLYDSGTQNVTIFAGHEKREVPITCVLDKLYELHMDGIDIFSELFFKPIKHNE